MTKKLFTLALSCVLTAASIAVVAEEQAPAPKLQTPITLAIPGPSAVGMMRYISIASFQILDLSLRLTDEQKPKVRELLTKSEEAALRNVEAQRKANKTLADALVSGSTETTLLSLEQAAMKADSDYLAQRTKALVALRAMLTDQQKKDLSTLLERATAKWPGPAQPPQTTEEPKALPIGTVVHQ